MSSPSLNGSASCPSDSQFFCRSPLAHIRITPRARDFIALVEPSRKYFSTISSASSRSEGSCSASNPSPSTAEHRTPLLSSSANKDINLAARSRWTRVCAVFGTANPRCHRVRDSSRGISASKPASSSAYGSSGAASFSVILRTTSAARLRISGSSPKRASTSSLT